MGARILGHAEGDPKKLVGGKEWSPPGEKFEERAKPPPKKTEFFAGNGMFW